MISGEDCINLRNTTKVKSSNISPNTCLLDITSNTSQAEDGSNMRLLGYAGRQLAGANVNRNTIGHFGRQIKKNSPFESDEIKEELLFLCYSEQSYSILFRVKIDVEQTYEHLFKKTTYQKK